MANVVDNLLKLTDYPFAFSLTGLVLSISGQQSIWSNPSLSVVVPFITLAGLLATSISITDPFGNLIRFVVRQGPVFKKRLLFRISRLLGTSRLKKKTWDPYNLFTDEDLQRLIFSGARRIPTDPKERASMYHHMEDYVSHYFKSLRTNALSTNWMSYEIDKIVSIFYFLVILILIVVSVNYRPAFNSLVTLLSSHDNTTGSLKTLNTVNNSSSSFSRILKNENIISFLTILLVIIVLSVTYSLYLSVSRLYKRNRIIVTYFYAQEKIIPTLRAFISQHQQTDTEAANEFERIKGDSKIKLEEIGQQ
jgi:hypothetical protein